MATIDFLEKTEIFKGLTDEQLKDVQECCREAAYERGDNIFKEGDKAAFLCILEEGTVDLRFDLPGKPTSEENRVAVIENGMTFLWSGVVPPYVSRLSSYCTSRSCKIVQVDRQKLLKLFEKDPRAGYVVMSNIAAVVGRRFYSLQEKVATSQGFQIMFDW